MKEIINNLEQRSTKMCLILNDNELNLLKSSRYVLNKIENSNIPYQFIAINRHDRDEREDDKNSYKTPHYHMVITFEGMYALGTVLNWLSDLFKINKNQIQIKKCSSVEMQTRYLIHLDDPDKAQYDIWDVATNDTNVLNRYMNLTIVRDLKQLITFVQKKNYNLEEIMSEIADYKSWRTCINDLIVNYYRRR